MENILNESLISQTSTENQQAVIYVASVTHAHKQHVDAGGVNMLISGITQPRVWIIKSGHVNKIIIRLH